MRAEKKYEYTSDSGNKYRIFISKYRNTNKVLVNGYHPGLGNSSQWQTEFIQEYMKNYYSLSTQHPPLCQDRCRLMEGHLS